ncbi:MAG: SBBP repeat-containing protein [Nitrososphaerota archaeon]|nr:SBBP repeat-containing protein [Candidatus Calditenuis fumarioli]
MGKAWLLLVLMALLTAQLAVVDAELVTFRQLFGGSNPDFARGIAVDSSNIYVVGETQSFGPNTPNLFLSIFRLSDNLHRCSVAVDLGSGIFERGWKVAVGGGNVYALGDTNFGPNPPNVLLVKFDTNCNVLGAAVYDIESSDIPGDIAVSDDGSVLYVVGKAADAPFVMAVRTADFSVVWTKFFRVTSGNDFANSVALAGGKLYVTGRTETGDVFVSRFDAGSGNHELSRTFATSQIEEGRGIAVVGGKVYVVAAYEISGNRDFLFMKLDAATLNLEFAKTVGTPSFEDPVSVSVVGGLIYGVGRTDVFGSADAALIAVRPSDGELSHAFVLARDASAQIAQDSASTGSCLIYAGFSDNWPAFYAVLDGLTTGTLSFTIASPTPSIAPLSITPAFPPTTATGFTPTFNSPAAGDAFYSWFCPDNIVVATTTTSTALTTATLSTTVTSVVGSTTTVFDVRTTTITQTSTHFTTSTGSVTVTVTQTQSTTRTETTTITQSTTYSTTYSTTTTLTQSTTTTLSTTTTSTQYFAEPVSTYVVPALLAVIAALLGASLVLGRRRRFPY